MSKISSKTIVANPNALPAEDILSELVRVETSALFSETTRMKRFLRYVVEEALAGRSNRLKGYSIGLEVFDRADSFDPQADTIVRVQAGQMRRRLDLYYGGDGKTNPIRIMIPKGSYVPHFVVNSPPRLEQSTPALLVDSTTALRRHVGPSVAVVTFTNLSGDDDSFFAEGMTSEIINALVRFRFLRILARTATVEPSIGDVDIREVGRKYGADYVLTGNIRRAGDLVRVTADLIDARTTDHVFTSNYDRRLTPENLLVIQEDIASYVAAQIGSPSGYINRNGQHYDAIPKTMTAYEAVLRFYDFMAQPRPGIAADIKEALRAATQKSPEFSSAWAALCLMITTDTSHDLAMGNPQTKLCFDEALSAAEMAVKTDPQNALGYHAMFSVCFHQGNMERYERAAQKALKLNPNDADICAFYGLTQLSLGHADKAQPYFERALELNTQPPFWYDWPIMASNFLENKHQKTIDHQDAFLKTPNFWSALMRLACLGYLGREKEAAEIIEDLNRRVPDMPIAIERILRIWHINPTLADSLKTGWTKAGLDY